MSSTLRQITFEDDLYHDAFGRMRTSENGNRLDVEFLYGKQDDYFDEITSSGTVTHNANTRDLTLSIANTTNGTSAEMRSYPVPYTPGCSHLVEGTSVLDLANLGTGTAEVFLRTTISGSTTTSTVTQASWVNGNNTGISWRYSHIFGIDFQSLKVGRIRFFMVRNGLATTVATIQNDNLRDSGFWQMANGSVYFKLYNASGNTYAEFGYGSPENAVGFRYVLTANASATMKAICCTVKSEGGDNLRSMSGLPFSIDNGVTAKTVATTLIPLISIRPRSTFLTYDNLLIALPKALSVQTDNPIRLAVLHDCTLTGASFGNVDTNNSMMEYDVTASAIATAGHVVASEYVATAKNTASAGQGILGKTVMWYRRGTASGILTLAAVRTTTTSASVLASINWEEMR